MRRPIAAHGAQAQRDLSASDTKIGDVRLASGDAPGALAAYQQSRTILSGISPAQSDAGVQRDLSASFAISDG